MELKRELPIDEAFQNLRGKRFQRKYRGIRDSQSFGRKTLEDTFKIGFGNELS